MMLDSYVVPDKELRVAMSMRIDTEGLSGQTSSTSTAHKGFKPKVFNVSLIIPFDEPSLLTKLTATAQATQPNGDLKIYSITDELANAVKVRKVQFTEEFFVRDMDNLRAWSVQFSLQDYQSVPEKVEQRKEVATAPAQTSSGQVVAAEETQEQPQADQPGFFERQLAKLNEALA